MPIDIIAPSGERLPARDPVTGKPTKAPKGARYQARWRTPSGASRKQMFARKVDATAHLNRIGESKDRGGYVDQSAGRVKFGEYARSWAERQPHRALTAEGVSTILDKHIIPTFGHRPLAQISTSEVQAWVTGLSRELAPSTVATVYQKLTGIFRSALDDRRIAHSPCGRAVKLPRPEGGEIMPMTPAEVRAIVDGVPDRWSAFVVLLAGTGLRPAEGLGLCTSRVDWLRRQIRVDQQLITVAGQPPTLAPPKTETSSRTIPVPQSVLDVLSRHVKLFGGDTDDLLFHDENGNPVRRSALGHMWRRAMARINKAATNESDVRIVDRTPHDLRHYAASVMIDRGANVKAVQRHLGHASAKVTLDTYSHLWPDAADTTRAALEAGLQGVVNDAEALVGVAR